MDRLAAMRTFAGVVETGSFSAAGRQAGMAPSSISRQINELEDDLGARLFHRTTRKLSLTEAGETYYERVRGILNDVDEARLAIAEEHGRPSGVLRVSVPAGMGRELLIAALPDFLEQNPAVRVVLSMTDHQIDLVEGGYDLGIRVGRQRDSSLIARKIGESRRLVCASPAYLARAGEPRSPADLADHNCLTFREHPGSNLWRFRGPEGETEVRATGNLFSGNSDALGTAAVAGMGIILLPDRNIGDELRRGVLRPILQAYQPIPAASPLYAVYPHQRHLPPKVRAFIDFLVDRLAVDAMTGGPPSR